MTDEASGSAQRDVFSDSDEDDLGSLDSPPKASKEVEDVLASFREKWQSELAQASKVQKDTDKGFPKSGEDAYERQARDWFLNGDKLERAGKLYEAIQFYKRAVQLVPDIEFKINDSFGIPNSRRDVEEVNDNDDVEHLETQYNSSDEDEPIKGTLLNIIQRRLNKSPWFCKTEFEQRATHISSLPMELLLYIFKWVVSSDLDLRSLEMCSMVSRGFYVCARDQEIWRLACTRLWGPRCAVPNGNVSWRQVFLDHAFVHFNGCYISKTSYIRHGENSFQDQFYQPWYLVTYYRYIRFFSDGFVLILTTPQEPSQCVGLLKNRDEKDPSLLTGHYLLKDDKVLIVAYQQPETSGFRRGRRRNECAKRTFHLEFQINSHNGRKHVQLAWTHYSVFTRQRNGAEAQSIFDIAQNRFPPLWFSRVKSYTREFDKPLQ